MRKLLISTGSFFKYKNPSILSCINRILKLDVDGIELMFATEEQLNAFKLTGEIKRKLANFEIVGIHAPIKTSFEPDLGEKARIMYGTAKGRKILTRLKKIYDAVGAQYIVVHANNVHDYSFFHKQIHYTFCIENLRKRSDFNLEKIKKIARKFPDMYWVLDIDHAMQYSPNTPRKIAELLGNNIKNTHLSFHLAINKQHQPTHTIDKNKLSVLNFIKGQESNIVVELWSPSFEIIKKEVAFVRREFCQ